MDTQVESILTQLSETFTVPDLMVKVADLTRASDQPEAQQLLSKHPEFDIIPLPSEGAITSYLHRNGTKIESISPKDLISDGTSLIDLPKLFTEREFFFVLSSNTISGFVHFSDLNKGLMKLPFFVLFEAVERNLWSVVAKRIAEEDLSEVLDKQRIQTLKQRMKGARKKDVDLGWAGLLSFDEILKFSINYDIIRLSDIDRELLANFRNRVAHSDRLLVEEQKDTHKLVRSREICLGLLSKHFIEISP